MADDCLSGKPSKTAAKPVPSSCGVAVSSHAEGTANVARLMCFARLCKCEGGCVNNEDD